MLPIKANEGRKKKREQGVCDKNTLNDKKVRLTESISLQLKIKEMDRETMYIQIKQQASSQQPLGLQWCSEKLYL